MMISFFEGSFIEWQTENPMKTRIRSMTPGPF